MESISKYKDKENYIVPMTVAQKGGHLHAVILGEMAAEHIVDKRVLHVGCNAATTTHHIGSLKPTYLAGIDVNEDAIKLARVAVPEADFTVASAHEIPLEDDYFDTIILFSAFEHFFQEDKAPAVEEFQRILKPGGCILVQIPRAIPGSKDQKLKQNAYDPHCMSLYPSVQSVHDDFPAWDCLQFDYETRPNPNNGAHHSAWVAIYMSPKKGKKKKKKKEEKGGKKNPSAQIRSGMSYGNPHDY